MISTVKNNKSNVIPNSFRDLSHEGQTLKQVQGDVRVQNDNKQTIVPVATLKAYTLAFSARKTKVEPQAIDPQVILPYNHAEKVVKSVKDKNYQGLALYIPEGKTTPDLNLQWQKIKWENLKQEPIKWDKAKKEDILAFWHALGFCEIQETAWVNKFNPSNVLTMLSTGHAITSKEAKEKYAKRIEELKEIEEKYKTPVADNAKKQLSLEELKKLEKKGYPAYLDQPLIDPKTGKFAIDFTVFDTETTGVGDFDRVIQIGAVQFKDGKPMKGYNKFFDPEIDVPQGAVNVHGLSREVLLDKDHKAKPLKDSLLHFNQKILGNNLVVAYNAQFDIGKMNHEIDLYNLEHHPGRTEMKRKQECLTLDPFLMLQRIHPFVGARKRLGQQYKFFFGKDLEGTAHDALDDVKATVDILKYTTLYLNKNFKPTKDKKALTVKDLLTFQFGGEVKGLNIPLHDDLKIDNRKTYKDSYIQKRISADGYPNGCTMENGNLENIESQYGEKLGEANLETLRKLKAAMSEEKVKKYSPQKMVSILGTDEFPIKEYKGVPKENLIGLICINSPNKVTINSPKDKKQQFHDPVYVKNINTWDVKNDLPDMEISRQVMLDKSPAEIKALVKKGKLSDLSGQEQPEYYAKF